MARMICVLLFCLFGLLSFTDGLNCIVCTSTGTSSCGDPFSGDTSSLSQSGFSVCSKVAYTSSAFGYSAGYVARAGYTSSSSCTSSSSIFGGTYCCSDKDNCNTAMGHRFSIFTFVITLFLTFQIFHN